MRAKFIQLLMLLALICYLGNLEAFAQACDPPTSVTQTITNATCRSNGVITINTVTGNITGTPQYRLYNQLDNAEVRQWQDPNVFTDLPPATYTLHVRYSCNNGFSTIYKKTLTVGGNYVDPSITAINVNKRSQCNNGQMTVTATSGRAPYTYALVSSQTATEPVAPGGYVRPPQTSNVFTGLAAGTYYVRVYDACNSYVTRQQVIAPFTPASNVISNLYLNYTPCDKLKGTIYFSDLNNYLSTDVRTLSITYPDGTIQTLPSPTSATGAQVLFDIPMERLGVLDPTKSFPDNISTWPLQFKVDYTDECGMVYTNTFTRNKPVISLALATPSNVNPDACGSSYIYGTLSSSTFGITMPAGAEYQVGGGAWNPVTPTVYGSQSGTQSFTIPYGQTVQVCVRTCGADGPVYCRSYASVAPSLSTDIREYNRGACVGNSGVIFRSFTTSGSVAFPITVHLLSGPEGVSIPDFTYTQINVSNYAYPPETSNLPLGTYKFRTTDLCGNVVEKEVTLTRPTPQLTATYSYPCGSTDLDVAFQNMEYYNGSSTGTTGFLYAQLYNLDGTSAGSARQTADRNTASLTLPTSSLANGDYIIKIWKEGAATCKYDIPFTKTSNLIQLEDVLMNQNCPGTPTTSTVTAYATSGVAPYRYSLYRGSYAPENLIVAAQSSNVFNDVQGTGPFVVFAEDACGRGTQGTVSTDVSSLRVSNTAGGKMPCPGSDLILSILNVEGATYQWFKDGSPISGATTNSYTVTGIDNGDSGEYTVELKMGTCPILYRGFTLDPNRCNEILPVNLTKFALKEVKGEGQTSVRVDWETVGETKNEAFQVMRSANLIDWMVLGEVKGKGVNGESMSMLKYSFTDLMPLSGVSYYQLKQVDFDQNYELSRVESIELNGDFELVMTPNPVVGKLTIKGDLAKFKSVVVYNAAGVKILSKELGLKADSVDLNGLPAGIYVVTVININGIKQSKSIVKL